MKVSYDAATAFRTGCYDTAGLVRYKPFDNLKAAETWAENHIKDCDKIVVEGRVDGRWGDVRVFKKTQATRN